MLDEGVIRRMLVARFGTDKPLTPEEETLYTNLYGIVTDKDTFWEELLSDYSSLKYLNIPTALLESGIPHVLWFLTEVIDTGFIGDHDWILRQSPEPKERIILGLVKKNHQIPTLINLLLGTNEYDLFFKVYEYMLDKEFTSGQVQEVAPWIDEAIYWGSYETDLGFLKKFLTITYKYTGETCRFWVNFRSKGMPAGMIQEMLAHNVNLLSTPVLKVNEAAKEALIEYNDRDQKKHLSDAQVLTMFTTSDPTILKTSLAFYYSQNVSLPSALTKAPNLRNLIPLLLGEKDYHFLAWLATALEQSPGIPVLDAMLAAGATREDFAAVSKDVHRLVSHQPEVLIRHLPVSTLKNFRNTSTMRSSLAQLLASEGLTAEESINLLEVMYSSPADSDLFLEDVVQLVKSS